ncbi:hypothetical protein AAIB41_10130 [Brucella sp. BE17]|uniref:hypothetical protein n=1 Tax=Brucella sp. BE17 TaxID=3142977 RepID=UPI0031BB890C
MDEQNSILSHAAYFLHIRIIAGIFVSLCMSKILMDLTRYIQFPTRYKLNYLHIIWLITFSLAIIEWWWGVFEWSHILSFSYSSYIFVVLYAFSFYFLASLITPGDLPDHESFDQYFMDIRRWFYFFFALNILISNFDFFLNDRATLDDRVDLFLALVMCAFFLFAARSHRAYIQRIIASIILVLQVLVMVGDFFIS